MPETFVTSYSWLLAPGDALQVDDYSTPTRVKSWLKASAGISGGSTTTEKGQAYGQWIAQLLQVQLGIKLVKLYTTPPEDEEIEREEWPIKLSPEAIGVFEEYFAGKALALEEEQEEQQSAE